MTIHTATRVSIVAEKLIRDGITRIIEEQGGTGYSVFGDHAGIVYANIVDILRPEKFAIPAR